MMLVWLPIALITLFAILGIAWFGPELRANFLIWRGREQQARQILETLLLQNPEKLQLCRKLARIYYLENRRDRKAIWVYELIIRFKIPFEWREDLYTIIAKHYIVEGRKDTEAIRIIEKAANKEIKKIKSYAL